MSRGAPRCAPNATRPALGAVACLLAASCLGACIANAEVGADCEAEHCAAPEPDAGRRPAITFPGGKVPSGDIAMIDVLFVIDASRPSMTAQQAALAAELPRFFQKLVDGDLDGGGAPEFHAARDLQVGVISGSFILNTPQAPLDCIGSPLNGFLLGPGDCAPPRSSDDPRFSRLAPTGDATAFGIEAACRIAMVPQGCRVPQPLEAGLEALADTNDANAGFLRDGALLVVIVLSDGDDCSLPLDPAGSTIVSPSVISSANVDALCVGNPDELQPVTRYFMGLAGAQTTLTNGVMFFAIAGVPPNLVNAQTLARTRLEEDASRDAFYRAVLEAPAMQQTIDTRGTSDLSDDEITPVCNTERGLVRPSRRIVEVARSFGVNGLVQSICEPNLARPLDAILANIGHRLGAVGI